MLGATEPVGLHCPGDGTAGLVHFRDEDDVELFAAISGLRVAAGSSQVR